MDEKLELARRRLVADIEAHTAETAPMTGRARLSETVIAAMAGVPRERFVKSGDEHAAFIDRPLPIGRGQTISQPFIVALMTDLLDIDGHARVLEIGTGSGYQTAVLAALAGHVYTVERIAELAKSAARRFRGLGLTNISQKTADGFDGWAGEAPFDAILVTAAPDRVPAALIAQLAPGGRLVVPVGPPHGHQVLKRCLKSASGRLREQDCLGVSFVPMVNGTTK